jgi:cobalt-zinc-cadmium efflux system protein
MTTSPVNGVDCAQTGHLGEYSGALRWALAITLVFMVAEVIGGWWANSLALLADAGHMLGDVASLGLALLAARLAQRPATGRRTYGYLRVEIFASVINGAVLIVIAGLISWRAVARLGNPPDVESGVMLAVAAAGFVANLVTLRLLHAGHRHSLNVRGAYLHVVGDLLGSVGALAAAAIIALTGWTPADAVVSAVIALLIAVGAVRLLRDSVDVLLEATPRHISLERVADELDSIPGVSNVHDLHVWTVTSGVVAMTGHAVIADPGQSERILAAAADRMGRLGIGHVTFQLEPDEKMADCRTQTAE